MTAVAACCSAPIKQSFGHHLAKIVVGAQELVVAIRGACLACGNAIALAEGAGPYALSLSEITLLRERLFACEAARAAVAAGVGTTATQAGFPEPLWLASMNLLPTLSPAALLNGHDTMDEQTVRAKYRAILALADDQDVVELETPISVPVRVDSSFCDHIFELDPDTNKDRWDNDHVLFAPLIPQTLAQPLEVWRQQLGGKRTQKTVFLRAYIMDAVYLYHVVIVKRDNMLLTSYRLNGGRAAFLKQRLGVPLHVAY